VPATRQSTRLPKHLVTTERNAELASAEIFVASSVRVSEERRIPHLAFFSSVLSFCASLSLVTCTEHSEFINMEVLDEYWDVGDVW